MKNSAVRSSANAWQPKSAKDWLASFDIDAPDITINDLALDSREVSIHRAFLAVKGHKLDGREFIPQAISLGAMLIIAECETAEEHGLLQMREHSVIVHFYQLNNRLSELGELFYDQPSKKLHSIAVTGTNGKTSTTHFIAQLAELCGSPCGLIGTLGAGCLPRLHATGNTTPNGIATHRIMAEMVSDGAQMLAFEASSHAMALKRITHVQTKVAVLTNLSRDHLDFHSSMAEYAAAKRALLNQPGLQHVVLNMQDQEHKNWLQVMNETQSGLTPVLFGVAAAIPTSNTPYCIAKNVRYHKAGTAFELVTWLGEIAVDTVLLGEFNVANFAAAVASLLASGVDIDLIRQHVNKVQPVPGRMEMFSGNVDVHNAINTKNPINTKSATFVVDFAHTPDALEQVLTSIRRHIPGNVWVLFGCGGERDQGKRPLMGEIASRLADKIILTSDNSRGEDTEQIIQEIQSGLTMSSKTKSTSVIVIPDRQQAVMAAVKQAQSDDVVVLAGKGHEDYQIIGEQTLRYDERAYVKTLLQEAES